MANRFVPGGTIGPAGQEAVVADEHAPRAQLSDSTTEWEAVQQELEQDRKRREEQRLKAATGEEKSLYDILQANKAAKQAAFEEQNRIRNQFRALDDDEIEFLDEVVASKRKEEERVRKETEDGLRAFREQQRRTGGGGGGGGGDGGEGGEEEPVEGWSLGRKRKRGRERERGLVRRKTGDDEGRQDVRAAGGSEGGSEGGSKGRQPALEHGASKDTGKKAVGLVSYGSDDGSDD
ncbi:uncharacterized protein UV8b_02426 [Ustilaginoidea virens]|uniref:FAM192A/Fyv6 N-terminal domain-containing protein n=1 Tax=Ustilaginoidea virens TaxID=1159556 RepID=A0A1B5L0I9_USTVR|nr:uncharacterized protein UV8b_02426 [Ustilaginoidea virens]QUC18185.1 hypothetical protein UV8b_02426 [Ustilaginoidea virens]GAO15917.1 hypothetical protein UVI_02039410 [Ustilaginoidea virens]